MRVIPVVVACVLAVAATVLATPAYAQMGSLKGKVVDAEGKPVADAELVFEYEGGYTLKMTAKTNAKGEWVRSGMQATSEGVWNITVTKGDLGARTRAKASIGETIEVPTITVRPGGAKATSAADTKAADAARAAATAADKYITQANAAMTANNFDAAITALTSAIQTVPTCAPCYGKLGDAYLKKEDLGNAEKSYLKAVEMDPKLASVYDMLASLYNQQKKFEDAGKMSAKANEVRAASGGGGDAGSLFNAGVIAWNSGKMDDAQSNFEKAIALDPNMAEAYYQLGMVYVNQNKLPEAKKALETYVAKAPTGKNIETAKAVLTQLK